MAKRCILAVVLASTSLQAHAAISFQDVSAAAGINANAETYGASWGDFNGDGDQDLYVNAHRQPAYLFLNQGNGTFVDQAASVFVGHPLDTDMHGAAWGDFDRDGDQDLLQTTGRNHPKHLFENDAGLLTDQSAALNIGHLKHRGRTPLWLDWTNDGLLDFVLAGFRLSPGEGETEIFEQTATGFEPRSPETGFDCTDKTLFANLADLSGDGVLDLICGFATFPTKVYDITTVPFTDITAQFPTANLAHDVALADFDGNLMTDYFVSRMRRPYPDTTIAAKIFFQTAAGFEDRTAGSGVDTPLVCHSVVAGDFDNDGDIDLYRVCYQSGASANVLLENQGDGTFVTVSGAGGAPGSSQGLPDTGIAADYDGDGFLDLFVANGWCAQPASVCESIVHGPLQLYRNTSGDPGGGAQGNHWVQINLQGVTSNPNGIGARVLVTAGGVTQLREQNGGVHVYAQNQARIHVGLGANVTIDDVTVHWPSGVVQTVTGLAVDQVHTIVENTGPLLDIDDVTVNEDDGSALLTVTLTPPTNDTVTVDYATQNGSALAGSDYTAVSDSLTFLAQETTQSVNVALLDDADPEPTETFTVVLSNANNAGIGKASGAVTVLDDDAPAGTSGIGDFVWDDDNGDGIQDAGESGRAGVTVNLLDCGLNPLDSKVTDGAGGFLFDGLAAGDYTLEFVAPAGLNFSPQGVGTGGKDSDADPVTGLTNCRSLAVGQVRRGVDAGLTTQGPPGGTSGIGDFVWDDDNGDGIQDAGESGRAGVTVNLLDCGLNPLDSKVTDGAGGFLFDGLAAGDYTLEFVAPAGLNFSPQGVGTGGKDSDADPVTGLTNCRSLAVGQVRRGVDAGLVAP